MNDPLRADAVPVSTGAITAERRYRTEAGRPCIDIELRTARQLFDERDPAPFRERDLSEDAVDYIVGAAEEIAGRGLLNIVIWIAEPQTERVSDSTILEAVRGHFAYELARLERRIRQHLRLGQITLLGGFAMLVVLLTLAEVATMLPYPHARQILREGLVIIGWVAIWRPLEFLLYDWWPRGRQRRLVRRILDSQILIRHRESGSRTTTA